MSDRFDEIREESAGKELDGKDFTGKELASADLDSGKDLVGEVSAEGFVDDEFDEELSARLRASFDSVAPDAAAKERMFAAIMAEAKDAVTTGHEAGDALDVESGHTAQTAASTETAAASPEAPESESDTTGIIIDLEAAREAGKHARRAPRRRNERLVRSVGIAACLLLALGIGVIIFPDLRGGSPRNASKYAENVEYDAAYESESAAGTASSEGADEEPLAMNSKSSSFMSTEDLADRDMALSDDGTVADGAQIQANTQEVLPLLDGKTFVADELPEGYEFDFGWEGSISFDGDCYRTAGGASGHWCCEAVSRSRGDDLPIYYLYFGVGECTITTPDDYTDNHEYFHEKNWLACVYCYDADPAALAAGDGQVDYLTADHLYRPE